MRVLFIWIAVVSASMGLAGSSAAAEQPPVPLRVLYLARENDERRAEAFIEFLSARFAQCTTAKRADFDRALLIDTDVVILDWSQSERHVDDYPSPLGPLEEWDKPLVLLGSAGLLIAGPWEVIGGAG